MDGGALRLSSSTHTSPLVPARGCPLLPQLSAHLNSALSDDKSYQQMNDAKMRGMSAMVGWDQFHGMVLTAHLKPVNLRAEPIDEMAKGVPRQRKLEQARQRNVVSAAVADASGNAIDEKQAAVNAAFLKQLDMQLPNNGPSNAARSLALCSQLSVRRLLTVRMLTFVIRTCSFVVLRVVAHEWARDWKRLAANGATGDELQQLRYRSVRRSRQGSLAFVGIAARAAELWHLTLTLAPNVFALVFICSYLLTLPLSSPSTSLLKGGLPLDIIADSIAAIHSRWTQQQPDWQHTSDAVEAAGDATAATADATGATASATCSTESAPATADSLPPPCDVSQLLTLLQRIAGMSSFSIALFSLTAGDKAGLVEILDIAHRAVESDSFREWQRDLQAPAVATAEAAAPSAVETATAAAVDSDSSTQAATSTAAPAVPAAAAVAAPSRRDFDHTPALDNNTRALVNDNAAAVTSAAARNVVPSTPAAAASPAATVDAQLVELLRTKFKLSKQ